MQTFHINFIPCKTVLFCYIHMHGCLVVNPEEARQVRELFLRFANGHSLRDCWHYMQQYTNKYGNWKSETLVRNVLKNEVYMGRVKFQGKSYAGRHSPIIEEDIFRQVQEKLNAVRSSSGARTLLSGLLFCGCCGARFYGEHGNYSCCSRTRGDRRYVTAAHCKNKKWKIPHLDALVLHCIRQQEKYPDCSSADSPLPLRRQWIQSIVEKIILNEEQVTIVFLDGSSCGTP